MPDKFKPVSLKNTDIRMIVDNRIIIEKVRYFYHYNGANYEHIRDIHNL